MTDAMRNRTVFPDEVLEAICQLPLHAMEQPDFPDWLFKKLEPYREQVERDSKLSLAEVVEAVVPAWAEYDRKFALKFPGETE